MCGLAGWFSPAPIREEDVTDLKRMIKAIAHRGPDGQGYMMCRNAALGHVRLSIIDIENGKQPMTTNDGAIHIIFNGEIYNYREIRKNLQQLGCVFLTTSDTEVILLLYSIYGVDAFSHLRGMFAVAIWDENNKKGILARDQAGIKPLFYKFDNGELTFASEVKGILAKTQGNGKLDINSLHLLMNFRYVPGNLSLFKDVVQLSPGEIMEWNPDGKIKTHRFRYKSDISYKNTLDALEDSVKIHLASDVEVGCYLSGGIDSASVAFFAARNLDYKLKTFTLNVGDDPEEAVNARQTADLFNMDNYQDDMSSNIQDSLPRMIWHLEVPKINALQVNDISRLASRYVKVALSGLGGDEIFLGYNVHGIMYKANRYRNFVPETLQHRLSSLAFATSRGLPLPVWSEAERSIRMLDALGNWPRFYGLMRNLWDSTEMRQQVYGPRMLSEPLDNAYEYLENQWIENKNPVSAMADFESRNKMVNDLLWQEDRCSMAEGLEVRVPFLDPVLIKNMNEKDIDEIMPNGQKKGYMRKILTGTLPDNILKRRKSGFQVDARNFYNSHLKLIAKKYLSREIIEKHGLFNPHFVEQVTKYNACFNLRWHYFMLYLMLTTHIWLELFEENMTLFPLKKPAFQEK